MTLSIGANTQNTLYPTIDILDSLNSSNLANPNLSPTAANDFGPAVIISLSSQALDAINSPVDGAIGPLLEPVNIVEVTGHAPEPSDNTSHNPSDIENAIANYASGNPQYAQLDENLNDLLAILVEPDDIFVKDGRVHQQFSKEKVIQAAKLIINLKNIAASRNDPAVIGRAYGAIAKINESPLGKAIGAMQAHSGTDLEGLVTFMQNLPAGQGLDFSDDNTVLVTGERPASPPTTIDNGFQIMPIPTDLDTGFSIQEVVSIDFMSPILSKLGIEKVNFSLAKFGHIMLEHSGLNKAKGIFANDLQNYDAMNRHVLLPVLAHPISLQIQPYGDLGRIAVWGNLPYSAGWDWNGNPTTTVRVVLEPDPTKPLGEFRIVTAFPDEQR